MCTTLQSGRPAQWSHLFNQKPVTMGTKVFLEKYPQTNVDWLLFPVLLIPTTQESIPARVRHGLTTVCVLLQDLDDAKQNLPSALQMHWNNWNWFWRFLKHEKNMFVASRQIQSWVAFATARHVDIHPTRLRKTLWFARSLIHLNVALRSPTQNSQQYCTVKDVKATDWKTTRVSNTSQSKQNASWPCSHSACLPWSSCPALTSKIMKERTWRCTWPCIGWKWQKWLPREANMNMLVYWTWNVGALCWSSFSSSFSPLSFGKYSGNRKGRLVWLAREANLQLGIHSLRQTAFPPKHLMILCQSVPSIALGCRKPRSCTSPPASWTRRACGTEPRVQRSPPIWSRCHTNWKQSELHSLSADQH